MKGCTTLTTQLTSTVNLTVQFAFQSVTACHVYLHRKCMAVAFLPVLQKEVSEFVQYWNTHRIRKTRNAECPGGRPVDLFEMPNYYGIVLYCHRSGTYSLITFTIYYAGVHNCLKPLNPRIYLYAASQTKRPPPFYDSEFFNRCNALTQARFNVDLFKDVTPTNCISLYKYLVNNTH